MARHIIRIIERVLTIMMALAIICLTLLVFVDVIGRGLFNRPVVWGGEVVEILVAVLIASAFPLIARSGENISIELVPAKGHLDTGLRYLTAIAGFGVFLLLGWVMFKKAADVAEYNETTMILSLPLWIFAGFLGVLFAVTAISFLIAPVTGQSGRDNVDAPGVSR